MAEPKGDYSDGKMIAKITGQDKGERKPPKKKLAQVFDLKTKRLYSSKRKSR